MCGKPHDGYEMESTHLIENPLPFAGIPIIVCDDEGDVAPIAATAIKECREFGDVIGVDNEHPEFIVGNAGRIVERKNRFGYQAQKYTE